MDDKAKELANEGIGACRNLHAAIVISSALLAAFVWAPERVYEAALIEARALIACPWDSVLADANLSMFAASPVGVPELNQTGTPAQWREIHGCWSRKIAAANIAGKTPIDTYSLFPLLVYHPTDDDQLSTFRMFLTEPVDLARIVPECDEGVDISAAVSEYRDRAIGAPGVALSLPHDMHNTTARLYSRDSAWGGVDSALVIGYAGVDPSGQAISRVGHMVKVGSHPVEAWMVSFLAKRAPSLMKRHRNSVEILPALSSEDVWFHVQDLTPISARNFLVDYINRNDRNWTLLQVPVSPKEMGFAGTAAMIGLLMFFAAHLRYSRRMELSAATVAWVLLFGNWWGLTIAGVSSVVIPPVITGILLSRYGPALGSGWGRVLWILLLIATAWASWELVRLWWMKRRPPVGRT